MTWVNEKDEQIVLCQKTLKGNTIADNEHSEMLHIAIGDTEILYLCDRGVYWYYWNNDEYRFSLQISGTFSQDMIIKLIQSIKKK